MEFLGESEYKGFRQLDLRLNGRQGCLICPASTLPGKPWIWRCEFLGAFDTVDLALLSMGFHLAYYRVSDMYGCPDAVRLMHEFQEALCSEYELNRQAILFGFSRGGLYAVNYALAYPYDTALVYLDAPVLDIKSWPCGAGGDARCAEECLSLYHLTRETLPDFHENPLDRAEEYAALQIPTILVAGGADKTVPYAENGAPFCERVQRAGGVIETILKPDCAHHPHSLDDPRPVTDFIAAHTDFAPQLPNTVYRLRRDRALNVGYFGGSITENGAENGWRGKTTSYLRAAYPDAEIREIQAAIGGTGTSLGIFRCQRDLLDKKPDLVFLEFAVNDYGDSTHTAANTETILRKIYAANPYAEIVVVFTLTRAITENMARGIPYRSRNEQMRVARRYGLPTVNIGDALFRAIRRECGGDWLPYVPDTVHPNAAGYVSCAAEMQSFLAGALNLEPHGLRAVRLPAPLCTSLHPAARLADAAEATADGFTAVEKSLCGRYPRYFEGRAGASLSFSFTGTTVGLYWMMAKDSGKIEYSLDGGEPQTRSAWDTYCPRFNRAGSTILAADLPAGAHELRLRVLPEHDDASEGDVIRIGAFLVG